MVSKCRRIAEVVAVMEMAQVGVTTRARAALAMGGATATSSAERKPKRRKINNEELKFSASTSFVQLKGRTRADVIQPEEEKRCSSPTSDELSVSCCSSNGSIGLDEERIEFVDLEVDSAQGETSTCNCGDERLQLLLPFSKFQKTESFEFKKNTFFNSEPFCRPFSPSREMSSSSELRRPNSEDVKPTEASTCCISSGQKMPTELELEEFFTAAENDIQKRFAEKYNYDIVKDVPLEGRYEWVQIKP